MNRGLEQIPERWKPRLRNFLIYILPFIVVDIVIGEVGGDVNLSARTIPALAIWGLTGRIQAVPIAWAVLLIGEPALVLLIGEPALAQLDRARGAIWILTAIGAGTGIDQDRSTATPVQEGPTQKRTEAPTLVRTLPEGGPASQAQNPPRLARPVAIALVVIPGYLWDWWLMFPLVLFAINRLAKEAICPDCRQHIPKAKAPFDTEAVIMAGLIALCIAGSIGTHIINEINEPSAECATALETVKEGGGPDLWTISEADLDRWLEEDPDAWETLDNVQSACWPDDEGTP